MLLINKPFIDNSSTITIKDSIFKAFGYPNELNGACVLKYEKFENYSFLRMKTMFSSKEGKFDKLFCHVTVKSALDLLKRLLALDPL
jgi:hypothetical protein